MKLPAIKIQAPDWLSRLFADTPAVYPTAESRILLAIQLAKLNVDHQTGGPFGAAIFDMHSHELIAPGVNLVVPANCSSAHAEIVAISMAQQILATYNLADTGLHGYELVSSTEPCAMCLGAITWSGIHHLACAARDEDARGIGFDEGAKHPHWIEELNKRGISVETDRCRNAAIEVLQSYARQQGVIYNAGPS